MRSATGHDPRFLHITPAHLEQITLPEGVPELYVCACFLALLAQKYITPAHLEQIALPKGVVRQYCTFLLTLLALLVQKYKY